MSFDDAVKAATAFTNHYGVPTRIYRFSPTRFDFEPSIGLPPLHDADLLTTIEPVGVTEPHGLDDIYLNNWENEGGLYV